jgi:5-methylcytosine-specific restriction endonuclease McrA
MPYADRDRQREHDRQRMRRKRRTPEGRESSRYHNALRRARKANATVDPFTREELAAYLEEMDLWHCTYCPGPSEHLDHVIPLSRHGPHALHNLRPACQPCNLNKGAKLLTEWAPYQDLRRTLTP